MQYYKVKRDSDQFTKLTVSTYERDTEEKFPFYQTVNGKKCYFAFCPGCSNPIRIYNLYNNKRVEGDGRPQKTHARHYPHPIKSFPAFDQDAYDNCPFANPSSFSGTSRRGNGKEAQELVDIIKQHTDVLFSFVRSTAGINFSEVLFEKMLASFNDADGIYFRHVNKFNLPFSFLYMAHNHSLRYQFVLKQDKNGVAASISKRSNFFKVCNGQIKPKDGFDKASINLFFTDHKVSNRSDEPSHKMTLVIVEKNKDEKNKVLETVISFDNNVFYNTVSKNKRLRDTAFRVFG